MKENKKRVYGLADYFSGYMDNIGQLTLVNLLFCVPAAVFTGIILLINYFRPLSIFVFLLLIPLLSPISAGLFYGVRRVTMKQEVKAWRDMIHGIKTGWKGFLINGIIACPIVAGVMLTFSLYRGGLSNPIILMAFIFSLIFVLFFAGFENSMLTMLVSVELKPSELIRNSVLLFIGGFFGHVKIILSYALISCLIFSVFMITGDMLVSALTLLIPVLLLLPALCAYIVVYNSYQTIEKNVINPYTQEKKNCNKKEAPAQKPGSAEIDREELVRLSKGDPEEYVFLDGRMIKRKAIKALLEEKQSGKSEK